MKLNTMMMLVLASILFSGCASDTPDVTPPRGCPQMDKYPTVKGIDVTVYSDGTIGNKDATKMFNTMKELRASEKYYSEQIDRYNKYEN